MKKKEFTFIFLSIFALILLIIFGIYKCPIKYIFGLSCPICGLTRAFLSAFSLNFSMAFHYHLFWPIILLGLIIWALYKLKIIKLSKKTINISLCAFSIINLIYYFYRLFNGSEIVYFNFSESLIYKLISLIR